MDILLVAAIVVTALAVIVQAGALVAMYLMSRKVADRVNELAGQSQRLMAPLENVTQNLKAVSADLAEVGKTARHQAAHIDSMVKDTQRQLNELSAEIREQVAQSVDEIRMTVMRPVREGSAIMSGISEGIRVLFGRAPRTRPERRREDTAA